MANGKEKYMYKKIIDFIQKSPKEFENDNTTCVISVFDKEVNFAIFICKNNVKGYLCGGHTVFCSSKEANTQTLCDLYQLHLKLKEHNIKLVVDFDWFLNS